MASKTAIGSSKVPVALPYGTLAVGNASGTLYSLISSITGYVAPKGGWVIGMSALLSGTLTTGTLNFYPTKNGAPMTNTFANGTINIGTLSNFERDVSQQGGFAFKQGDTIGMGWSTTGTIAPTTRDLNGIVMILMDDYQY